MSLSLVFYFTVCSKCRFVKVKIQTSYNLYNHFYIIIINVYCDVAMYCILAINLTLKLSYSGGTPSLTNSSFMDTVSNFRVSDWRQLHLCRIIACKYQAMAHQNNFQLHITSPIIRT